MIFLSELQSGTRAGELQPLLIATAGNAGTFYDGLTTAGRTSLGIPSVRAT